MLEKYLFSQRFLRVLRNLLVVELDLFITGHCSPPLDDVRSQLWPKLWRNLCDVKLSNHGNKIYFLDGLNWYWLLIYMFKFYECQIFFLFFWCEMKFETSCRPYATVVSVSAFQKELWWKEQFSIYWELDK